MAEIAEAPPVGQAPDEYTRSLERVLNMVVGAFNGQVGDDGSSAFPWRQRYSGVAPAADVQRSAAGTTANFLSTGATPNHLTMDDTDGATSDLDWTIATLATSGDVGVGGGLSVGGNSALGNEDTDLTVIKALLKVQNAAGTNIPLYVTGPDNKVLMGSVTPLSGASEDKLDVIGGSVHIATTSAASPAIAQGWRLGLTGTTISAWVEGATSPNLVWFDDTSPTPLEVFRIGAQASSHQAVVTGSLRVTTRAVIGATGYLGTEELRVNGQAILGGTTITADGLTVQGGGANITGTTILDDVQTSGDIDCGGDIDISGGLDVTQQATFNADIDVADPSLFRDTLNVDGRLTAAVGMGVPSGGIDVTGLATLNSGLAVNTDLFRAQSNAFSFFGAAVQTQQTITGVRTGTLPQLQTVVANMLSALANHGVWVDSTT